MNTESIAFAFVCAVVVLLALVYFVPYFSSGNYDEQDDKIDENAKFSKENFVFCFELENNTEEEIVLDLCKLDSTDIRYSFKTSTTDYAMLLQYLKTYSMDVARTRVMYHSDGWQKDVIRRLMYTPFATINNILCVAFHNYDRNQFQKNIIDNHSKYQFDFFNSVIVTMSPRQKKDIIFNVTDSYQEYELDIPRCAVSVKNNSDVAKRVKLFDREYWKMEMLGTQIEIATLFDSNGRNGYLTMLDEHDSRPLIAKKIKFFIGNDNKDCGFRINREEHKLMSFVEKEITINPMLDFKGQFNKDVVDVELESEMFIGEFHVDIDPHTEILISFK